VHAVHPVPVASVADHVERALRERILAGALEPGSRLHQEALSEELGVSRTPLREALGRLAADGLVEMLPNRGARVADVRPDDMRAAYEARLAIEPAAAGLGALRASPAALDALRAALRDGHSAPGDVRASFMANRAFHLALIASSGNVHLMRLGETLWAGRVGLRVYERQRDDPELLKADADAHAAIVDAVVAHDRALAEKLTHEHIACAMDQLLGTLAD
jgi:DNA-binding GntR family transcriptional regulator